MMMVLGIITPLFPPERIAMLHIIIGKAKD
jgi:hypothetical protein